MLIAAGANVEAKNKVSGTEYGIRRRGADCRVPPFFPSPWQDGETPLHKAARNNRLEVAQALIAAGANVEAKNNVSGTEYGVRRRGADAPRNGWGPRRIDLLF